MLADAANFFKECLQANAPLVVVENPTMHGHAVKLIGRKYNFCIQPWEFGHPETKRTCFWTTGGVPPLMPTCIVRERSRRLHNLPPTPDRAKIRSRTFPGVAKAMAQQWGSLIAP